jgi:hypothetical protein
MHLKITYDVGCTRTYLIYLNWSWILLEKAKRGNSITYIADSPWSIFDTCWLARIVPPQVSLLLPLIVQICVLPPLAPLLLPLIVLTHVVPPCILHAMACCTMLAVLHPRYLSLPCLLCWLVFLHLQCFALSTLLSCSSFPLTCSALIISNFLGSAWGFITLWIVNVCQIVS